MSKYGECAVSTSLCELICNISEQTNMPPGTLSVMSAFHGAKKKKNRMFESYSSWPAHS